MFHWFKETVFWVCVKNTLNFVFKIWEMVEKIKTYVDRLIFQIFQNIFLKLKFFQIFKPKIDYLREIYILYHFQNFEKKILCTLNTNMSKL